MPSLKQSIQKATQDQSEGGERLGVKVRSTEKRLSTPGTAIEGVKRSYKYMYFRLGGVREIRVAAVHGIVVSYYLS